MTPSAYRTPARWYVPTSCYHPTHPRRLRQATSSRSVLELPTTWPNPASLRRSSLAWSLAHGLVTYLGNYPYACTEQLVSQAMPALLLAERPEFGYVRAQPGADIEGLINELRVRQNDEGAFRLWPGGNHVVEFVSLYAQ